MPKDSIIVKEGFLSKIGKRSQLLVSRFFILRDHALFIYQNRENRIPSNVIFLRGMFINEINVNKKNDLYGFSLSSENKLIPKKFFYHKSKFQLDDWI